jgi:serine/threonine-protein kinase
MQREKRRVARWLPWLTWIGILGGVVALVLIATRTGPRQVHAAVSHAPSGPVVPDVSGLAESRAQASLERTGFWVQTASEASARVPRGRAVGTAPGPASPLGVGAKVTLLISSGPPRVNVPSVQGMSQSAAEDRLLAGGFRVVVVRRASMDPPGAVIGQSPSPGRRVGSRAVVNVEVADRPVPAVIPDVTGQPFERAVGAVSAAGFAVAFLHRPAARPADVGRILGQAPPPRRRALPGARVTLTVGVRR